MFDILQGNHGVTSNYIKQFTPENQTKSCPNGVHNGVHRLLLLGGLTYCRGKSGSSLSHRRRSSCCLASEIPVRFMASTIWARSSRSDHCGRPSALRCTASRGKGFRPPTDRTRQPGCTRNQSGRKLTRWVDEHLLEAMAQRLGRDRGLYAQRKALSEHPFGTMKRGMDQGYFLLKGLRKVRGEFSLTALAYNLKRVINLVGVPRLLEALA